MAEGFCEGGAIKSQDVRKDQAPQVVLVIKNHLPGQETEETRVWSLSWEEDMATYSMGRGVWWTTVHRVAKSQTWLKRLSSQTQGRIIHSLRGPSAPKQSVVQRLILEMMQLLFLAARAVGFSPCIPKSCACTTYLHNTDTQGLLWMVGENVNSPWKTVRSFLKYYK